VLGLDGNRIGSHHLDDARVHVCETLCRGISVRHCKCESPTFRLKPIIVDGLSAKQRLLSPPRVIQTLAWNGKHALDYSGMLRPMGDKPEDGRSLTRQRQYRAGRREHCKGLLVIDVLKLIDEITTAFCRF
jgi:hypothetical protein